MKILIIDDEDIVLISVQRLLARRGYAVTVSPSGSNAIEATEGNIFDLIISDVRMPGLNGVETVKQIKKLQAKLGQPNPQVIFLTGYADVDLEQEAKKLNPIGYILKPFDAEDLLRIIENVK